MPARRSFLLLAPAMLCAQPLPAVGAPPEVAAALPGARLQGSGRLRALGLHVYDARLWSGARAPGGADWGALPFALELVYARELEGAALAERSLAEMRRQGDIADEAAERWLGLLKLLLPDVKAGDRLSALHEPGVGARFFHNGRFVGEPREAEFVRRFFGIWLAPGTSEPALRRALLGLR